MKQMTVIILIAACICALPFLLPDPPSRETTPPSTVAQEETVPQVSEASFDETQKIRVLKDDGVEEMTLHDYLVGVLLAEVPGDFPAEALKSQAVASRTFALKKMQTGKHENADVCASAGCCQGWSQEGSSQAIAAVTAGVEETDGLVLTYQGELIDATFFSCSGGKTEAAAAVWGGDVPYLQSVDSPGEEGAPRYSESVVLDRDYFVETMTAAYPQINLAGDPAGWFGPSSWTEGGGLDVIFIGGLPIEGRELRKLFSLRSTDMSFTPGEDSITVTTHGFGHRVGLSQYGAAAMAEAGEDFTEILCHYYQNVEIRKLLQPQAEQLPLFRNENRFLGNTVLILKFAFMTNLTQISYKKPFGNFCPNCRLQTFPNISTKKRRTVMQGKVEICGVNTARLKTLKNEEMTALLKQAQQGDEKARQRLIEGNLRLVLSVIQKFLGRGENPDDLFQVGCVGLLKAISNFNTDLNVRFSTYGVPMIEGEVKRYLRDYSAIRVSRSLRDTAYRVLQCKEAMQAESSREPTLEDIAKRLEMTPESVSNAMDAISAPVSLYEPVYSDGGDPLTVMDQVRDTKNTDERWLERIALKEAISALNPREKRILTLRFFDGKTQMEVAGEVGISQAQVSRLEKNAITSLRKAICPS